MNNGLIDVIIAISASALSGLFTAMYASRLDKKKDKVRQAEKTQDSLKIELKDLQIKLYQLEIDLAEWKDKYYEAIQELISVKSELEKTLIKLEHVKIHED